MPRIKSTIVVILVSDDIFTLFDKAANQALSPQRNLRRFASTVEITFARTHMNSVMELEERVSLHFTRGSFRNRHTHASMQAHI
jgi:hypothetical protein